jgi:L-alanine-DL-glutamate epimerase-like enolase superfamily enzyme
MKITRVRTTAFTHPSPDCLLEIEIDDGLTGIAVGSGDAGARAAQLGTELLVGEDPRAVVALWQKLLTGKPDCRAVALLDMALWDLKAKSNDEPLWKTLGGARPRANAYVSFDGTSTELVQQYGFREGKMRAGPDIAMTTKSLTVLRDALLQNAACPVLMIDSADHWTAQQAISNIKELEESFDLTWVECRDGAWGGDGLRQVSENVFAAVCAKGFSALDPHAADIVQLDLLSSGITGALQIADAAYGFELPITLCASPGNIAAHVASAMPNFMSMEVSEPTASGATYRSDVTIEDGRAVAGDKPGLGLVGAAE